MAVKTTRKKLWHLRYQRPATKQRIMMGLGAFPALSLSDARRLRADYLSLLANGNDPKTQPEQVTEQQQISVGPKYRDTYSTHIPAVILVVNNNPMRFTDRSGGVTRRRVILHFPEIVSASERDPQLKEKIRRELAVIVRHLMQRFSQPQDARTLLQSQQNSGEAMRIKRDADPLVDFCGYLFTTPEPNALYMGNASIRPVQPKRYLYHAYLTYMEANGYINPLSMKMFGLSLDGILREYGLNYLKRRTKLGIQTNLDLSDESSADWLPKCDQLTI